MQIFILNTLFKEMVGVPIGIAAALSWYVVIPYQFSHNFNLHVPQHNLKMFNLESGTLSEEKNRRTCKLHSQLWVTN